MAPYFDFALILQFKVLCKKLWLHLEDVMSCNHMRVVVQLATGALRHGMMQDKFIKVTFGLKQWIPDACDSFGLLDKLSTSC